MAKASSLLLQAPQSKWDRPALMTQGRGTEELPDYKPMIPGITATYWPVTTGIITPLLFLSIK